MLKRSLRLRKNRKMVGITLALVALSVALLALTAGSGSKWYPGWGGGHYKPHPVIVKPVIKPLPIKNITKNTSDVNIGVDIDNTAMVDNSGFTVVDKDGSGKSCGYYYCCGGCGSGGGADTFNDLQDLSVEMNQLSQVGIDVDVLQGNKSK